MSPEEARLAGRPAARERVLLKLSGELLGGATGTGLGYDGLTLLADQITEARATGAEIAVVLGGGNLVRGSSASFLPRALADGIGMLGTLMNALAMQGVLARRSVPAAVYSAFDVPRFADLFRADRACERLAAGEVVLLAGGTGHPYLTTDTAAALRAIELGCTLLVKGTKVDGVYSADPLHDPSAERYTELPFEEVLSRRLGVMDLTAITLCMENDLAVVVLNATTPGSVARCLLGQGGGTRISRAAGAMGRGGTGREGA
jgi:uridylate kinase